MTQALELKEVSTFHLIQELKTQFETYKDNDTLTLEVCEGLIIKVKELLKGRNMANEIYFYCKEHHESLIDVVKILRTRLEKKDNQICVEAETGQGKSVLTMCLHCCLAHMTQSKFDLDSNVLYMPRESELSKRLMKLKENELLWVDETIKSINKLRWQNRDVQESSEIIQTERFRHNTIIYCIPSFNDLTRSFKNVNIKFRIWIAGVDPARAVLRAKEKQPDLVEVYGAWHTNERASFLKEKITPVTSVEEYIRYERQLKGYMADFSWPNLEAIEELTGWHFLYELYKKRARIIIEEQEPEADKAKNRSALKQKEVIKCIMKKDKSRFSGFTAWYKEYKDFITTDSLKPRTLNRYWDEINAPLAES